MRKDLNKNKTAWIALGLCLCIYQEGAAQENLIRNPGFEEGAATPTPSTCIYDDNDPSEFDNDVDHWNYAEDNGFDKYDASPNWMDPVTCNYAGYCQESAVSPGIIPSNRVVVLIASGNKKCALRSSLRSDLIPGRRYILRFKIAPFEAETDVRIMFTKLGENWNKASFGTNINQKWKPGTPDISYGGIGEFCTWEIREYCLGPVPEDFDELGNIVFKCDKGRYALDDVELYEDCGDRLIENQTYDGGWFYNPNNSNFWVTERAGDSLVAGNDVGAAGTNGNVVVQANAWVTYRAGETIDLLPGFRANNGSYFDAAIQACASCGSNKRSLQTKEEVLEDHSPEISTVEVMPNPTTGLLHIQVPHLSEESYTLKVISLVGQQVYYQSGITKAHSELDLSHQPRGVYLVQVESPSKKWVQKILLQ